MATPAKHHAPRRKKQPAPKRELIEDAAATSTSPADAAASFMEPERRRAMISDAAYFRAEAREFCPGHEMEDWLEAEREIDQVLGQTGGAAGLPGDVDSRCP